MQVKKTYISILKGIDQSTRMLPMLWADSGYPGPVLWLTAAIHGDEVTGTAVIQSVFKRLEQHPLKKGKIYAFPILNPSGFETISRREAYSESDLNRSFDSSAFYKDSIADKLAILIISTIMKTKPNYAIDLHTDSAHSIPYIIVDLPGSIKNNKIIARSISLAKKLGFFWAIETEESSGYPLEKSLSGQLLCRDIPAVTIELGGPLLIINKFRKMGLEAVWSFLYKQKMVDFSSSEKNIVQTFDSKHKVYGFYYRARTNSTGIIEYRIKPGQFIKKDMVIGKIRNVFGEIIEVMRSPVNGILLSHEDQSVTFPGQSLFTIAVESSMKFSQ